MEIINIDTIIRRGRPRKEIEDTYESIWNETKRKDYNKTYYLMNKDKHPLCREEIICECGRMVLKTTLPKHIKMKCHIETMNNKKV